MDEATEDVMRAVEGHARAQQRLLAAVLRALFGVWGWRTGGPWGLRIRHDPILANGAVAESILLMQDGLEAARELEVAFVADYSSRLGVEYEAAELAVDPVYVRNADFQDVYSRAMTEYRWQRYGDPHRWSEADLERVGYESVEDYMRDAEAFNTRVRELPADASLDEAVDDDIQFELDEAAWQEAMRRMETIVEDDLRRAADQTHIDMLDKKRVWLGYRRVIHPELSESGTCGLCVAAATRIYYKKALAPMHSHCKCTTIGVSATRDVGGDLNERDADQAWDLLVQDADGDETRIPFTREQLAGMRDQGIGRSDYLFTGDGLVDFRMEDLRDLYEAAGSTYAHDLREVSMDYGVNENGPVIRWVPRDGLDQAIDNRVRGRTFTPESLATTRQKWYRAREWAGKHYQSTLAAVEKLRREGDPNGLLPAYERALRNFENVAASMGDNLRTYLP